MFTQPKERRARSTEWDGDVLCWQWRQGEALQGFLSRAVAPPELVEWLKLGHNVEGAIDLTIAGNRESLSKADVTPKVEEVSS